MRRRARRGREIIKLSAILAADIDQILKSRSGNERRSRAFALQQSIGRDSGSVHHFGIDSPRRALRQSGENNVRRRAGIRTKLESFQASIVMEQQ